MTLSPTKWTQHFGDLAGYGAAVLVLGAAAWSAAPLRARPRRARRRPGRGATVVASLVLAGYNVWPYVGDWFTPTFSTVPPQVAGVPIATSCSWSAGGWSSPSCSPGRRGGARRGRRGPREALPAPAARARAARRRGAGGGAGAAGAQPRPGRRRAPRQLHPGLGRRSPPCAAHRAGCSERLSVETDPAAGLLPVAAGGPGAPDRCPSTSAARRCPAWRSPGGWPRRGSRSTRAAGRSCRSSSRRPGRPGPVTGSSSSSAPAAACSSAGGSPRTARRAATTAAQLGAGRRRHRAAGRRRADGRPALAPPSRRCPRVPRADPDDGPAAARAAPRSSTGRSRSCSPASPRAAAAAAPRAVPEWRVGPPADDPSREITYLPRVGGPFVAPRLLVTEQRMATYLCAVIRSGTRRSSTAGCRSRPLVASRARRHRSDGRAGWYRDGSRAGARARSGRLTPTGS